MASLTQRQKDLLSKHSRHHTKKHMDLMKKLMLRGVSFSDAHKMAMKMVGERRKLAQTPAPAKDRIKGSKRNKPGVASTKGKGPKYKKTVTDRLADKAKSSGISLSKLKKVYARGLGAFSTSHRPGMTRNQWAMGRVNAFIRMYKSGKPKNKAYTSDNDLLPSGHPWKVKSKKKEMLEELYTEVLTMLEAEYKGRKVTLMKPFRLPKGSKKKFGVYVKSKKDNVIMVKFGDPNMEIKRDDPERRKSFRARHMCDSATDVTTPRYWSCKMWEPGKSVSDLLK